MVCETCPTVPSVTLPVLVAVGAAVALLLMVIVALNKEEVMLWWIKKIEWIQQRWFK